MAHYAFRSGHSIRDVNPQIAGNELERIRHDTGALTPENVVKAAADSSSPLHQAFEWDDTVAAHQHRLNQARRLVVSVRIIDSPAQSTVPAFVSVRTPDLGRSYLPVVEALNDEDLRVRILQEVQQFVESVQRRYAHFEALANLLSRLKQAAA